MSFLAMWLELIGFSHGDTAVFMTVFSVATSLGGLLGGKMGDALAHRYPNAGRIVLSQISAGSGVPLAGILLLGLPNDPSTGVAHVLVLFVMGLVISWNSAATNSPIFAEIVPVKSRTSIYALDSSFESILASFAPPGVGFLSQRLYGFKLADGGAGKNGSSPERDRENAASLAKALYTAIAIPFTVCTAIYSFLYCSYPRDRDRARMQSLIGSKLQQMELLEEREGSGFRSGFDDERFELFEPEKDDGGRTDSAADAAGTARLLPDPES
uniref:Uncharacterized protein n=1 Tax=Avena sativa TaxID=4498 RepID=A0ACD5Y5T0_AVESA